MLGTIIQLQVQRSSLKIGERRERRYDPSPICQVVAIELEPGGVVGWTEDDERILDVHHRDHPLSKNRDGDNGISIGFTSHYDRMRECVGQHLLDGLAGENILLETEQTFTLGDLPERLMIERVDGSRVELVNIQVAEPCVEFTRFAMQFPPDLPPDRSVTTTLKFFRGGTRGYYATYLGAPARIQLGDRLKASF